MLKAVQPQIHQCVYILTVRTRYYLIGVRQGLYVNLLITLLLSSETETEYLRTVFRHTSVVLTCVPVGHSDSAAQLALWSSYLGLGKT